MHLPEIQSPNSRPRSRIENIMRYSSLKLCHSQPTPEKVKRNVVAKIKTVLFFLVGGEKVFITFGRFTVIAAPVFVDVLEDGGGEGFG